MRRDPYDIVGVPRIAKAVLPFGSLEKVVNSETGEDITDWRIGYQSSLTNNNNAEIRTDNFLDDQYRIVSAVIACSGIYPIGKEADLFCGQPAYYTIHNPNALHPLPQPWLPGAVEYCADIVDEADDKIIKLRKLSI